MTDQDTDLGCIFPIAYAGTGADGQDRFDTCGAPIARSGRPGRPPEYCEDEEHTKGKAWAARRRLRQNSTGEAADMPQSSGGRPITTSRQTLGEIAAQVIGNLELVAQQVARMNSHLETAGDPEAVAAEIETVQTDLGQQLAAAQAERAREAQRRRQAEAAQDEADAAAADLTEQISQATTALEDERQAHTHTREDNQELAQQLQQLHQSQDRLEDELDQLRTKVATATAEAVQAAADRDEAARQAQEARQAAAEAQRQAERQAAQAAAQADRAQRAEETARSQAAQLDRLRDELSATRVDNATLTTQREAALADVESEKAHAQQRINDLRTWHQAQVSDLRQDLDEANNRIEALRQA